MAEIIDLDAALPPDKKVRIGGKTYLLPGDIPVELFLKVQRAAGGDGSGDVVADLRDALLELFQARDRSMKSLPLGMGQLMELIPRVYMGTGPDPPRPTRGATGTSRPRSRSRSSK